MLFETQQIFEDQLEALGRDSARYGTQGDERDLALLLDGLQAEREQGITIDVAYRFFATPRRRFIVADTPGHDQYTRNTATGASTADVAVVLVDARKGMTEQTYRHSRIVALLGVRRVVLAVNKMDLIDWDAGAFDRLASAYCTFAKSVGCIMPTVIPMSALRGDNVTRRSERAAWYDGPSLLEYLETVEVDAPSELPFRFPVQFVNRPHADFRGYCGRVASGTVRAGDQVRVVPGGRQTTVKEIVVYGGTRSVARAGDSVALTLTDDVDVGRGDVITSSSDPIPATDRFTATMVCLSEQGLVAGRSYVLKAHTRQATALITAIRHRIDVTTGAPLAATMLQANEIGVIGLASDAPLALETYSRSRTLGAFILIDRITNATVGAGMIDRLTPEDLTWSTFFVGRTERAALKTQRASCIWLTGLSGAGKSTIANLLDKRLYAAGRHAYVLDGDNIRHGLSRDLGFSRDDRVENVRRVAEVARLMADAGLIVIVGMISPFRSERDFARSLFPDGEFIEVFVATPLDECRRRDPKGLYERAERGAIPEFTGVDSVYETPQRPEIVIDTLELSPEQAVEQIVSRLPQPSSSQ
ncbi:MAG: sulfate adenylyltransferase, large subunit [Gemmatimonadetes bacterium]|nr:sulfate adenylyltransferase, large subunit [Gemmatimonadota bacterium]